MDLGAPAAFAMDLAAHARFQCLRMDQRRVCYDLTGEPETPKLTIVNIISDDEIHIEDGTLTDTADTVSTVLETPPTIVPHRVNLICDDTDTVAPDRQPDTEEQPDPMLDVTWPDRQPDTVPPDRQPDTEEQPDPMLDVTEEEPDPMLDVTWPPSRWPPQLWPIRVVPS